MSKTEERKRAAEQAPLLRSFHTGTTAEFQIRSDGDGRTIEAYAVPFGEPAEVVDIEGHYFEQFERGAFGRQLAATGFKGISALVNHGRTLLGSPSERFALPYGTPVEIREDGRGLFTATRAAQTELGEEILQLAHDDALAGMSITFARTPGGGGTKIDRNGHRSAGKVFDLVRRVDVRLIEYGVTPIPVYVGAELVGVRAEQLATQISELPAEERAELVNLLRATADPDDPSSDEGDGDGHEHDDPASDAGGELLALRHDQLARQHRMKG